jgi:hypothetical protein
MKPLRILSLSLLLLGASLAASAQGTVAYTSNPTIVKGMRYQGTYAGGTTYAANDVVLASGVSYVSLISSNTGNTPASSPSDWGVLGITSSTPGSIAVNGITCTIGSSCTITAAPPPQVIYEPAAVSDGGSAFAAALTRYDNNQPQTGSVNPGTSALGYMAFNASPALPQYAEQTVALPAYWTGTSLFINFSSSVTTGTVEWEVEVACTAVNTAVGGATWSSPVTVTTSVSSTANGLVTTAELSNIAAPGVTAGCPAVGATSPSFLSYRIFRGTSDTAAANANLLGITMLIGRSQ